MRPTILLFATLLVSNLAFAGDADPEVTSLLKQAKDAVKKQKYDEAIGLASAAHAKDATNTEALLRRAQAFAALKKFTEAKGDLDDALKQDSSNRILLLERAHLSDSMGDYTAAIADCTAALNLKKEPSTLQIRAEISTRAGKLNEAAKDYTDLLAVQPSRADILVARGGVYRQLGSLDRAEADFTAALKLNPSSSFAIARLSTSGKSQEIQAPAAINTPIAASSSVAPEVVVQPEKKTVLVAKKKKGKKEAEVAAAAKVEVVPPPAAMEQPPTAPTTVASAAPVVDPVAEKLAQEQKAYTESLNEGKRLMNTQKYADAAAAFTQAIALRPKMTEPYAKLCVVDYSLGKPSVTITDCTKAIEMNPRDATARYARGRAYLDNKQFDRAIEELSNSLLLEGFNPDAHYKLALAHLASDNLSQALFEFSQAIRQKPDLTAALEERAKILDFLGDKKGYEKDKQALALATTK